LYFLDLFLGKLIVPLQLKSHYSKFYILLLNITVSKSEINNTIEGNININIKNTKKFWELPLKKSFKK